MNPASNLPIFSTITFPTLLIKTSLVSLSIKLYATN
jgi:hypothetical protein